jgi:hypothetical protein
MFLDVNIGKSNPTPLVFSACEPDIAAEDWGSFSRDI